MKNTLLQFPEKFKNQSDTQPLPDIPTWMRDDLAEFESAWGVDFDVLVYGIFEDFLTAHWDLRHNRPKKLRWQKDEKKPGSYTRRRRNKLLNGGYSNE